MKKLYYVYCFLGCLATYILFTSSSLGRATDDNIGNTGAPGESTLCSNCHNNGSFGAISISIQVFESGTTIPASYYIPNQTYDMQVQVTPSMGTPLGYGFQLTAMRNTNIPYAAYSNLANNVKQKLITSGAQSGRTYLEQNGVLNNNTFSFQWTAPTGGTGNINFYATGVACNLNNSTGGDRSGNSSLILPEAPQLQVETQANALTCNGETDGSILVSVVTGVSPYSFLWDDGSTELNRFNLAAGNYNLVITDDMGQVYEETISISEPLALSSFIEISQPTVFNGDGQIEIMVTGGTPPYSLLVDDVEMPFNFEAPQGDYAITIQDANGCTLNDNFAVIAPPPYQIIASLTSPSCFDANNGAITLDVTGAFPPYSILWQDGIEGTNRSDLSAGIYNFEVTDQYGNSVIQEVILSAPNSLDLNIDYEPILCFGDQTTLNISATGGTLPYTGVGASFVQAGTHVIEVTDANGCLVIDTIEISSPTVLSGTEYAVTMSCDEGNIEVDILANGGTPPYLGVGIQTITNLGSYIFPIEDSNGCVSESVVNVVSTDGPQIISSIEQIDCAGSCTGSIFLTVNQGSGQFIWSDGFEGASRENLCPDNYSCTYMSEDGCTIVNQFVLEEAIPINVIANYPDSICAGSLANVALSISGGQSPYMILWDGIEVTTNFESQAGLYTIEVRDSLQCTVGATVDIGTYTPIDLLEENVIDVSCHGESDGSIAIIASSNSGLIAYNWVPNVSDSSTAINLNEGDYTITLTDSNGCSEVANLVVIEPSVLVANVTVNDTFTGTGTLEAAVTGGIPPYAYAWSNGSTQEQIDVSTGFYSLTVTDSVGCQYIADGLEIATSLSELSTDQASSYPNPFESVLHVHIHADYQIVNPLGQIYHEGSGLGDIDTSQWPSGVYYLMHTTRKTLRLVKN